MSVKTEHSDFMSGRAVGERTQCAPMPLDARKVMARRAAAELKEGLAARLIMRDGTANITVDSINILQARETPWQRRK